MLPILPPEAIRALDRATIELEPIRSVDLMERAATAFANALYQQLPEEQPLCVLAGSGNNGGDALVVARLLHGRGIPVRCVVLMLSAKGSADFEHNLQRYRSMDLPLVVLEQEANLGPDQIPDQALPDWNEWVVDGLFGSGLSRPPEGTALALIQAFARGGNPVFAIDVPSGLSAEGQALLDTALPATRTWTFETPKAAFMLPDRGHLAGKWSILPIGLHTPTLAAMAEEGQASAHFVQAPDLLGSLPPRPRFGHKRMSGEVQVWGGTSGMRGAALLCGHAALRAGAGLVSLVHPDAEQAPQVYPTVPELMVHPKHPQSFSASTLAVGPGLGTSKRSLALLRTVLHGMVLGMANAGAKGLVLDADALNILSDGPSRDSLRLEGTPSHPKAEGFLKALAERCSIRPVLTPHPGEYQRLFGPLPSGIARWKHLRHAAAACGCVVVLKGAYTATASPDGRLYINGTGNPGMATAGTGDVLAGIVAALLAQGLQPEDAAMIGVAWHGMAGDEAAVRLGGQCGLVATDLVELLPHLRGRFLEGGPEGLPGSQ